jgi:nitrogen fixation NifU-like protein
MLTEVVADKDLNEALEIVEHFRLMMHGDADPDEDLLGDAIALEGVAKYPVRVKCALLSWLALRDAIASYRETTAHGG